MTEPNIRHSHVKLNSSVTHLVQYGCSETFIRIHYQTNSDQQSLATIKEIPQGQSPSLNGNQSLKNATSAAEGECLNLSRRKKVIIFVPGNPGVLGAYHDFLVGLYKTIVSPSDKDTTIIGIGHNNFDHPDDCNYQSSDKVSIEESELNFIERSIAKEHQPHDVELQVLNKLVILKRVLKLDPSRHQVLFVGHSIGCYVIVRLLQDKTIAEALTGAILMHPALDNLALTSKGAKISRYFDTFKLDYVARFASYVCDFILPISLRVSLARRLCSEELIANSSNIVIESLAQLSCSNNIMALVEMAKSEFKQVRDIDHQTLIAPIKSKLVLLYATGDEWVNVKTREQLQRTYPEIFIKEEATLHAFTMDYKIMTHYVATVGGLVQRFFSG